MNTDLDSPFTPPQSEILASSEPRVVPASRGARLGATCIDAVFGLMCYFVGSQVLHLGVTPQPGESLGDVMARTPAWMFGAAFAAPFVLYAIPQLWMLSRGGWTIGKRLVGIRVVRTDGSKASIGRLLGLRMIPLAIGLVIPILGWFALLVDALFIFGASQRCAHDLMAGTIVVAAETGSRRPVRRRASSLKRASASERPTPS